MIGNITIIPKTIFTVLGVNPSTQIFPLVTRIRTPDWVSGMLLARYHAAGTLQANTTITIRVQNASYPEDDPSVVFLVASGVDVANLTIPAGTVGPTLFTANFAAPISANLRVTMEIGVSAATTVSTFGLSVDLVGRDA